MSTASRSRRLLLPLGSMLAAGALAVASGATFTSSSASTSLWANGTLTQSNSDEGAAVFSGENLKPGDTVLGQATITNTGTLAATFTLTEDDVVSTLAQPELLDLVITEDGDVIFDGDFGTAGSIALGTFAAGEARTYDFEVTLDLAADNRNQAKVATAEYRWDAVQTDDGVVTDAR